MKIVFGEYFICELIKIKIKHFENIDKDYISLYIIEIYYTLLYFEHVLILLSITRNILPLKLHAISWEVFLTEVDFKLLIQYILYLKKCIFSIILHNFV